MDPLNLTIDFTGVSAAGGLGTLSPGLHMGKVAEFQYFEDSGRLYAYIITDGIRHRESFNVTNVKSFSFLKSFCMSAGLPEEKLLSEVDIPFHKLCGREVYFNYTPPKLDGDGKAQSGSYPRYAFYIKSRYDQMASVMSQKPQDVKIEEAPKANGAGKPTAKAASDDFDFLLQDSQ
tara:strand:+ start:15096 stop:15623 length:528 start_codon:yes stop_codon:yes gene_type:complete